MAVSVKIEGIDRAIKDIKAYELRKKAQVKQLVVKTAFAVQNKAKRTVRVDSGRLRASITIDSRGDQLGAEVGSNVEYAASQEFGDPRRKSYGFTPYLFPAFESERPGFMASLKQLLEEL